MSRTTAQIIGIGGLFVMIIGFFIRQFDIIVVIGGVFVILSLVALRWGDYLFGFLTFRFPVQLPEVNLGGKIVSPLLMGKYIITQTDNGYSAVSYLRVIPDVIRTGITNEQKYTIYLNIMEQLTKYVVVSQTVESRIFIPGLISRLNIQSAGKSKGSFESTQRKVEALEGSKTYHQVICVIISATGKTKEEVIEELESKIKSAKNHLDTFAHVKILRGDELYKVFLSLFLGNVDLINIDKEDSNLVDLLPVGTPKNIGT